MITLTAGSSSLTLAPDLGGSVLGLTLGGHRVLRAAEQAGAVLDSAAFPLIPFAGRIDQGRFEWMGRSIQLAANFPPEPHAIHGMCWQQPWTVRDQTATSLEMSRHHDGTGWPWAYRSTQTFTLTGDALRLDLSLTNCADTPMPGGLGWHPYFIRGDAVLTARTGLIWAARPGTIGTRPVAPTPDTDLSGPRPVAGLVIDNAYDWPARSARMDWPGHHGVALTASDLFGRLVVYTPPGEDFFCVEPLSHAPDAHNRNHDPAKTGLRPLAPGETMHGTISLRLTQA